MNQRELFLRHVAQTSDLPLLGVDVDIETAKGVILTDKNGKKYIDLISGISVSNIGHCHPTVVEAIVAQSQKFMHLMVYGELNQSPQVKYAQQLTSLLPANLDCVYFTTSGSEAAEGALKLAKRATGRTEIVTFENAYHGSSHGALSVMGNEYFKNSFRPLLPGIRILPINNIEALESINNQLAAVIIEPVQGEAGLRKAEGEFLKKLREKCTQTQTLLIFDEIQSGFGRTGSLFAFEQYNVVPDILLIAKGMGGGLPIGAFVASYPLMQLFTNNPVLGHINTFGGNAVCVAAAQATLEVILEEKLASRAIDRLLQEANKIDEAVLGTKHPQYLVSLQNLATLYQKKKDLEKAAFMMETVRSLTEKIVGKNHPSYVTVISNIASLYQIKENMPNQKRCGKKA
jgi:acetylornithine/succinyldiaminopimelate/putrescine aminotransferase